MTEACEVPPARPRRDQASRLIRAPRPVVYQAFVDAAAVATWLPPAGMTATVHAFEPRAGGAFELSLTYAQPGLAPRGKTADDTDTVRGRFVALVPPERVVQQVVFVSDDPAFSGVMTITWTLADTLAGTEVTVTCDDVPPGIRPEDHAIGLRSSLDQLAAFTE